MRAFRVKPLIILMVVVPPEAVREDQQRKNKDHQDFHDWSPSEAEFGPIGPLRFYGLGRQRAQPSEFKEGSNALCRVRRLVVVAGVHCSVDRGAGWLLVFGFHCGLLGIKKPADAGFSLLKMGSFKPIPGRNELEKAHYPKPAHARESPNVCRRAWGVEVGF